MLRTNQHQIALRRSNLVLEIAMQKCWNVNPRCSQKNASHYAQRYGYAGQWPNVSPLFSVRKDWPNGCMRLNMRAVARIDDFREHQ